MAIYDLSTLAEVEPEFEGEAAGNSTDLSFTYLPDLAGASTVLVDDFVYFDCQERRLFKGLVKRIQHVLGSERVQCKCEGPDRMIDGQLWEPINDFYNDLEAPVCADKIAFGKTIQEFFDIEHGNRIVEEGSPKQWFNNVTIAAAIGALQMPPITTIGKGFMECVREIIKVYPYARFIIEFDSTTNVYPVGDLIIYDARVGRSSWTLTVGNAGKTVVDLDVSKTIEDCAEDIRVHARGRYVERYELLEPNWNPDEERIYEEFIAVDKPVEEGGTSKLPEGHEFIWEIQLHAQNVQYYPPPGVGVIGDEYRLFPGADFEINIETGEIYWLQPDEGEQWWWVNRENGNIHNTIAGTVLGWDNLNNTLYRRPFTYKNEHIKDGVWILAGQYYRLGERAYRSYKTKYPIADFRLERQEVDEIGPGGLPTGQKTYEYRTVDTAVDIFIPRVASERFLFEEAPEDEGVDFDELWPAPTDENRDAWNIAFNTFNYTLNPDQTAPDDTELPRINAHMLFPTVDTLNEQQILKWFVQSNTGVTFEPGTKCVELGQRQLISVPEIYDRVNDKWYAASPKVGTNFATWAVLAKYTTWETEYEERTNVLGVGRRYSGVYDSIFSYKKLAGTGGTEEVFFDNTDQLPTLADDVAEYFGTPSWEGTIQVSLTLNASGKWEIPYKVGDIINLDGAIGTQLQSFDGIIRKLSISDLHRGIAELEFGLPINRKNPFSPPDKKAADILGIKEHGPDQGGLQDLKGDYRG